MRELHKALLVTAVSASLVMVSLAAAFGRLEAPLTSGDLQRIAREALRASVDAAIDVGGLGDAVEDLETRISLGLGRAGFPAVAEVVRRNDFDPMAAFGFDVTADGVQAHVSVEGLPDPLLALRSGERRPIVREPSDPYGTHGRREVLDACVSSGYYHYALGAPDIFARMENRTQDPYHFGLEAFLRGDAPLTLDHVHFRTGSYGMSQEDARRYGL